jgi:hydrogenase maturation protein HypF
MSSYTTVKVEVKGIVQGVGFRPFVYHLAQQKALNGWVFNSSNGVEIEISGKPESVNSFIEALKQNPPPLARIDSVVVKAQSYRQHQDFKILQSVSSEGDFMPISPDIKTCDDCLHEMMEPANRRFHYPFINCTNCGPRFTIIEDIPYDRPYTTMSEFEMCEECRKEYEDPQNRRFHAQPIACPNCGPQVTLIVQNSQVSKGEEAIQMARARLKNGEILAIKGLGGYHLACDATNNDSVKKLRSRKKRSSKPFALMAFGIQQIERYCVVSPEEEVALGSLERPIVLLEKKDQIDIAIDATPGQRTLGMMLPYTPLHYLLLEPEQDYPELFIMTSGNISDEPIAYEDEDAMERLADIADSFLIHNRPIHMRVDDSVTRVINRQPYILRRSRGFAPNSFAFPHSSKPICATGAELKNTFCLTRDNLAFLSHHIGDLENLETYTAFENAILHYEKLFRIDPQIFACDLHPDYMATRYAISRAENEAKPLLFVQHHHAHLAACMAENEVAPEKLIIGLCFDGTGLGTDQAIWGGEALIGNSSHYSRRFHLKYVPLPGGDISIRVPARMALTYLWANHIEWDSIFPPANDLCVEEKTALKIQLTKGINAPPTSSMGRLFDAASSFIGVRQRVDYEGQAAIEMETLVDPAIEAFYPIDIVSDLLDPSRLWEQLCLDFLANTPAYLMASKFHNSIIQLCLSVCQKIKQETGISTVALSGGVWQNKVLLTKTISLLQKNKFEVLWHSKIPTNDGGIAFGQACIAASTKVN